MELTKAKGEYLVEEDSIGFGKTLLKLGEVKDYLGEFRNARLLHEEAKSIALRIGDSELYANAINAIGCSYFYQGQSDSSLIYFNEAVSLFEGLNDESRKHSTLSNLAALYIQIGQDQTAVPILLQTLSYGKSTRDSLLETTSLINLGVAGLNSDDFSLADSNLNLALTQAEHYDILKYQMLALENLGHLNYNFENYLQAVDYYDAFHLLKDSLYGAETALKIEQIQAEFELAKEEAITARQALATKEKELKNTELQLTIFGIIGFVVLLAGIALAWYTRRKAVQQAQTQAILDTKEAENKRVTDLFWKEIGLSSKEKKLILQGRELPEHTIPGAIAAAKFLSNQRHNPFLQLGLVEAVDHLLQNLFRKSSCNYHFEYIPIKLEKDGRLFSYRVIEDVLTHVADSCKEGDVKVTIEEKGKDLICRVSANQLNPAEDLNLRSAEARLSLVKGKVKQKEKEGVTEFKIEIPKVRVGLEEVKG